MLPALFTDSIRNTEPHFQQREGRLSGCSQTPVSPQSTAELAAMAVQGEASAVLRRRADGRYLHWSRRARTAHKQQLRRHPKALSERWGEGKIKKRQSHRVP